MVNKIQALCHAIQQDLFQNIAPFWMHHTVDKKNGGFYGRVANDLSVLEKADKGLILTTRILWTFSALHRFQPSPEFHFMAQRAYSYLIDKFLDPEFGGAYWMLDYQGKPLVTQKKIYGQAFTIYSLAEYYMAFAQEEALEYAKGIYTLVEKNSYDIINTGYLEAAKRDWTLSKDMRLSEKDMDEKKSMNTHLHLLEAYTNLLRAWPDSMLRTRLKMLVNNFLCYILDPSSFHFRLFFDEFWNSKSQTISYGHDLEGSWLLCEAAELLKEEHLTKTIHGLAIKMTDASLKEGFSSQYALYSEKSDQGDLLAVTDWWQQAESLVAVINAFQISQQQQYLEWALHIWQYIEEHFIDQKHGEWFYQISDKGKPNLEIPKVSEWKCPYHNARACMEAIKRLRQGKEVN
ncbi:MAG: AGE family epimerase/isomerase [Candidatus Brocadiae bacterium]|nr:AGE family epimerase/isomerase [Candidatus Brocadiia bacterium]